MRFHKLTFWNKLIIHLSLVCILLSKHPIIFTLDLIIAVEKIWVIIWLKKWTFQSLSVNFMLLNWFWLYNTFMVLILFIEIWNLKIFFLMRKAILKLSILVWVNKLKTTSLKVFVAVQLIYRLKCLKKMVLENNVISSAWVL